MIVQKASVFVNGCVASAPVVASAVCFGCGGVGCGVGSV